MNKGRRHWTDQQNARLRTLWATGMTARDIGQSLGGFSDTAIMHRASDLGLDRRTGLSRPRCFAWTAENLSELRRMHAEGYSGSEIGAVLGATRNAVIGKLHRLGAKAVNSGDRRKDPQKAILLARRKAKAKLVKAVLLPPEAPQSTPVMLMELPYSGACKFPVGAESGARQLFCGSGTEDDHTYCRFHELKAYLPKEPRKPRASIVLYRKFGVAA